MLNVPLSYVSYLWMAQLNNLPMWKWKLRLFKEFEFFCLAPRGLSWREIPVPSRKSYVKKVFKKKKFRLLSAGFSEFVTQTEDFFLALGRKHYFFRGWKKKIPASLKKFSPVWKNSRLSEKKSRVEKILANLKQIEKIHKILWVEKIQASQKIVKINKTPPWFLHPPK